MSKHTPAPWILVIGAGSKGYAGNYEIITALDEEHEANARLIASAPELKEQRDELLRACQYALKALEFAEEYLGQEKILELAQVKLIRAIANARKGRMAR